MDTALWLLIRLQARGWVRAVGRKLQSVRGILLALLGLLVFIPWIMTLFIQTRTGLPPETVRTYGPAYLLAYCVLNVLLSTGERAVYFSPAEVTFLFTGPFTRRQLLGYKVALTLLYALPTTLILAAVTHIHSPWFLAAFVGLLVMSTFMQLFGMAVSMAAGAVGARLVTRARVVVLVLVIAGGLLLLRPLTEAGAGAVLDSRAWQAGSAPLRWFFEAFLADNWTDLIRYAILGVLVNLVLLTVVFGLDADYLEAAAAYSSRVYSQIQRLRGGPVISAAGEGPTTAPPKRRRALPMPPALGGIGPLVWRQLVTALRSPGRLAGLVISQVILVGVLLGTTRDFGEGVLPAVVFAVFFMSVMLPQLVPFDFRGDIDRLEALKMLPLAPWRVAFGQTLPPALILSVFQWLLLAGLGIFLYFQADAPDPVFVGNLLRYGLAGAAVVVPINFVLFALENVLFLLFPARQMAATPGDFHALGRQFLTLFARTLVLAPTIAVVGVAGMGAYALSGGSVVIALGAAWVLLATAGAALMPLAGLVFSRVDVSRDKPG